VVRASGTTACVLHVPRSQDDVPGQVLALGDLLGAYRDRSSVVPMLNTSRAASAEEAAELTQTGLAVFERALTSLFSAPPLVKLEVLDRHLAARNDEVLRCLERLPPSEAARTVPLLDPEPGAVAAATTLGCRSVRMLAGRIGTGSGILDGDRVGRAIAAANGAPVILEGGISEAAHLVESARLGAAGVLVNSGLFCSADPIGLAVRLARAAGSAWPGDAGRSDGAGHV